MRERAKHFEWAVEALWKVETTGTGAEATATRRRCVAGEKHQRALVDEYHGTRAGGHAGHERTTALLSKDFYWPRMAKLVKEVVGKCATCQRNKANNQPGALAQAIDVPTQPVAVNAPAYARVPAAIISDRDPRFTADLWGAIGSKFGTTLNMTWQHIAHRLTVRPSGPTHRSKSIYGAMSTATAVIGMGHQRWPCWSSPSTRTSRQRQSRQRTSWSWVDGVASQQRWGSQQAATRGQRWSWRRAGGQRETLCTSHRSGWWRQGPAEPRWGTQRSSRRATQSCSTLATSPSCAHTNCSHHFLAHWW